MGGRWHAHDLADGCLWGVHGLVVIAYGLPMSDSRVACQMPMGSPRDAHGLVVVARGPPMGYPRVSGIVHGPSTGYL